MTRLDNASFRNLTFRDLMQQLDVGERDLRVTGPAFATAETHLGVDHSPSSASTPTTAIRRSPHKPLGPTIASGKVSSRRQALLAKPGGNQALSYRFQKRLLDLVGAGSLFVFLFPVLFVTFAVLMITTRGKPFFTQTRYGLCGRPFRLFKFRTMVVDAENLRHLVQRDGPVFKKRGESDPRITGIGRFLRKTSIDELPQLINVLLGQMSLVGPRPLSCSVDKFETWQLERLQVKPGLTCIWQVSGRSEIGFHEWMLMDLWYVRHQNLWMDAKLLWCTPKMVLTCRGAG